MSLKISSQYNYKHFYTITGATIDTPHDYSEIDMTFVYTGKAKPKYKERITKIIEKRLLNTNIHKNADEFFPPDDAQEKKIKEIEAMYLKNMMKEKAMATSVVMMLCAMPDLILLKV